MPFRLICREQKLEIVDKYFAPLELNLNSLWSAINILPLCGNHEEILMGLTSNRFLEVKDVLKKKQKQHCFEETTQSHLNI